MSQNPKKSLREQFSSMRDSLPEEIKKKRDAEICANLLSLEELISAEYILLYSPFKSEIDISPIFKELRIMGKALAFPRCEKKGIMKFFVCDESELAGGMYGIKEPPIGANELTDFSSAFCIVPCLAATTSGERLGYGGGYYDRFLAKNDIKRGIVVYSDFLISDDGFPYDEFDKKSNIIITEEGVLRI